MSRLNLYEINDKLRSVLEEINEVAISSDGEITDMWSCLLDDLQIEKENKILDIARYIKSLKYEAENIKSEVDKLNHRYKICNHQIERLTKYITMNMTSDEKYKDSNTVVNWRKSEKVEIFDTNSIPDIYLKTEITIMKSLIKSDIKQGIDIAGAKISTHYNLQIK